MSDLEVLRDRALPTFGVRLLLLFLGTALAGLPLMAGRTGWTWTLTLAPALFVCLLLLSRAFALTAVSIWLVAGLLLAGVLLVALVDLGGQTGDERAGEVLGWLIAGLSGGVAASLGPGWGVGTFAAASSLVVVAGIGLDAQVSWLTLIGPLTYCLGSSLTNFVARRGFAASQQATAALREAEEAQRAASERWRLRRAADRDLHDTVLGTLTLLALGGRGVPADRIRERCARDLEMLLAPAPTTTPDETTRPVQEWLLDAVEDAAAEGLAVSVESADGAAAIELNQLVGHALTAAVRECLTNVRRHSGVRAAHIAVHAQAAGVVVKVSDGGGGFAPASVRGDRMGLNASVRERIREVGGVVTVHAQPGRGTNVEIWIPR